MNIDESLPVTVDEALRVTDEVDVDNYFARIMRALAAEVRRLRGEREPPHCPTCACGEITDGAFRAGRQAAVADMRKYFEAMEK